jgi:hypothetical protein
VFPAVRRRDGLFQPQSDGGLLRDGVADVGVCVDERRQNDVRRLRVGLFDSLDPPVLEDDPSGDRFEGLPDQDGAR